MPTPRSGRLLVIGNCTLDIAFRVPRFPQPGETLLTDAPTEDVGGKGANQAVAAARSGASVTLCAALGRDEHGRMMKARLRDEGVGLEYVSEVGVPTDRSIIYVTPEGENTIVSTHAAAKSLQWTDVARSLRDVSAADVVLMQGNLPASLTRSALEEPHGRGAVTVLNPAPIHYPFDEIWPFVDYAILNELEMGQLTGGHDAAAGARVLLERGARHVVVTLGAAGAVSASAEGVEAISAERVDAVDATGAGDVFCGVFAAGLALGYLSAMATRVAVRAATVSVTRRGTQSAFPTAAEMAVLMAVARPT